MLIVMKGRAMADKKDPLSACIALLEGKTDEEKLAGVCTFRIDFPRR